GVASPQRQVPVVEAQAAALLLGTVTADAGALQDGLDVACEIDLPGDGGGQAGPGVGAGGPTGTRQQNKEHKEARQHEAGRPGRNHVSGGRKTGSRSSYLAGRPGGSGFRGKKRVTPGAACASAASEARCDAGRSGLAFWREKATIQQPM